MNTIYVAGHRNPDMDCTCAAHCYAALKSRIDPRNTYLPIRSGPLSAQIRDVFELAGVPLPTHFDTIAPWVGLVTRSAEVVLRPEDPVLKAFEAMGTETISVLPVISSHEGFLGMVGVNEIIQFTIAQNQDERPQYEFSVKAMSRVLPGKLIHRGEHDTFRAAIMAGAMPTETAVAFLASLSEAPVLVTGNRPEILRFAIERRFPAIVITGVQDESELKEDFSSFGGVVYLSDTDTVETIRLLRLSSPVRTIMDSDVPRIQDDTLFESAKGALINSTYRGLPVFKGDEFIGIISRRSFIERPRPKLIMVDHNEVSQAVPGAEQAQILEIVDHHRLAPPSTTEPIAVTTRVVGSSCTLIYDEFQEHGFEIEPEIAILLLSGIISDTVNLQSPTTTDVDRRAVRRLEIITGISAAAHAERLFSQISAMENRDPKEIVLADYKQYEHAGHPVGIGQVEVTTLTDTDSYRERLLEALQTVVREKRLAWAMIMVTDVIARNSLLLTSGFEQAEKTLAFERIKDRTFDLPGILSRKKQLLPEVMRVLDELTPAG